MARPTKNNVEYFPHYATARNGKTLKIIQKMYGNDGYAVFFKMLEILGETKGHFYRFEKIDDWFFLTSEFDVDEDLAKKILDTMAKMGVIDQELYNNNVIWSDNFAEGLQPVYAKRKGLSLRKPSFRDGNLVIDVVSDAESAQRKEKERKGKKRKGEDQPEDKPRSGTDAAVYEDLSEEFKNKFSEKAIKSFLSHRRRIKSAATQNALEQCLASAIKCEEKFGINPDDILAYAEERGWRTAKVDWIGKNLSHFEKRSVPRKKQLTDSQKRSMREKECQGCDTMIYTGKCDAINTLLGYPCKERLEHVD